MTCRSLNQSPNWKALVETGPECKHLRATHASLLLPELREVGNTFHECTTHRVGNKKQGWHCMKSSLEKKRWERGVKEQIQTDMGSPKQNSRHTLKPQTKGVPNQNIRTCRFFSTSVRILLRHSD